MLLHVPVTVPACTVGLLHCSNITKASPVAKAVDVAAWFCFIDVMCKSQCSHFSPAVPRVAALLASICNGLHHNIKQAEYKLPIATVAQLCQAGELHHEFIALPLPGRFIAASSKHLGSFYEATNE